MININPNLWFYVELGYFDDHLANIFISNKHISIKARYHLLKFYNSQKYCHMIMTMNA
jgi:hypothetical protein